MAAENKSMAQPTLAAAPARSQDAAATPTSTPTPAPASSTSTRGRGRGGRGGRGRGRGGSRGASNAAASSASINPTSNGNGNSTPSNQGAESNKPAPTTARGRGGTRRGRAKAFPDSRVQAAYERQRDLKSLYQSIASALKPALQELADRTMDDLLQNPEAFKESYEYLPISNQLEKNFNDRLHAISVQAEMDQQLAERTFEHEHAIAHQSFQVSLVFFHPFNLVSFSSLLTSLLELDG
jgi:hypothetical protein